MAVIKAGYRVKFKTWENDADNYASGEVEGLTREEAAFMVDFVRLFRSVNSHPNPGIGNMYEPDKEERAKAHDRISEVVEKHRAAVEGNEDFKQYFLADDGSLHEYGWTEYAADLSLTCGEFWTRVSEGITVEFIPVEVELKDVTEEFK